MSWKRVCAAADVEENQMKKVEIDGITLMVAKHANGYTGFPPLCPHMEEPLGNSGMLENGTLTCTKHLWQWNLETGAAQGMAEKPLLTYQVKREGDDLMAFVEAELVYNYEIDDDDDDDDNFFNAD